ncbi:hypothetical protein EMIT0194MI4_50097 [Pseudomonas sp. IT-194MI4]
MCNLSDMTGDKGRTYPNASTRLPNDA